MSLIDIQAIIENNRGGIRKLLGTVLKNDTTLYVPPSGEQEILLLMTNLDKYINEDYDQVDNLVKLAVMHYQFESIHPFYDGNGRTGRIINVLYLVLKDLLDSPILYLSKFIIRNKNAYYRLLQEVHRDDNWEDWILYILEGIEQTAEETLVLVKRINSVVAQTAEDIQKECPKIYSRELLDLLFYEFYTKITYIENGLRVTRKTASSYLAKLKRLDSLNLRRLAKRRFT